MIKTFAAGVALGALMFAAGAQAQDKPAELRIGISTFLSGSASVFGEPAKQAADIAEANFTAVTNTAVKASQAAAKSAKRAA